MPATITDRLKEDTRLAHASLEKEMLGHLRTVTSRESYARFLQRIYAFLAPLQARIDAALDPSFLPDYASRRGPHWIADDLAHLPPASAQAASTQLPHLPHTAAAFGALYVLEGSTLGGQVIAGMLEKSTGDAQLPLRYFRSYGGETRARWAAFREALIAFSEARPGAADGVVAAAQDTFTTYRAWLQTTGRDA